VDRDVIASLTTITNKAGCQDGRYTYETETRGTGWYVRIERQIGFAGYADGVFICSFNVPDSLKTITFLGGRRMLSPVCGFLPLLCLLDLTENLPKLLSKRLSPPIRVALAIEKNASTAATLSALVS
jgi:hypothetical protein